MNLDGLAAEIAKLPRLSRTALKLRWQDLYKVAPPACFTQDLLARGISHRLQESALGELPLPIRRQLENGEKVNATPSSGLRTGNRLVRRWRGKTYVVEVVDGGFEYDGRRFGSLSQIASHITGTHWSGPRFFGLRK